MKRISESGNVLFAIFGAIALVGVLGASVMTFMKGPLATSVRLTKINTAESQMTIGSQVAVMATAAQANNGDCDLDGYVEPMEWRAATTEPHPVGGGLVPLALGISKKDPWGTEYGYCVWNHGPKTSANGCGANMLAGYNNAANTVVALISAGPDKNFTTTCRDFATADTNSNGVLTDAVDLPLVSKAAETDDDIITSYTYQEATGASGGLWNLKTGDPTTATINKKIETTGVASLKGGVLLPDKSLITCDASTAGVMAMNATAIEICNGTTWDAITGGNLNGTGLVLSPVVSSGMNVTGGCGTSTCYSTNVTFLLKNNLTVASDVLVTSLSNTANFAFVSNNCNVSLAAGASCQMVVKAKASGNMSYAGTLNVVGNNSPLATLDGTATGFAGCNAGGQGPGGYYLACGVSGSYNLIVTPSGCTGGNTNPTCAGGTDTYTSQGSAIGVDVSGINGSTSSNGWLNTKNLMAYSGGANSFPAVSYCDGMSYKGYDDWYLPSTSEMTSYFYPLRATVVANAAEYWSSNEWDYTTSYYGGYNQLVNMGTGVSGYSTGAALKYVRCFRRDPTPTTSAVVDNTPGAIAFKPSYGGPAETRTSTPVTIYGVTIPITISVSGGTGAKFSINGGAYTSTASTATNGDQITLQATSPGLGQEATVVLTTGSSTTNWQVRTSGNNTIRLFTTSAIAGTGNLGGIGAADTLCTARANAASLPGSWVAILTGTSALLEPRLPWNWTTLKNMNGATVATSLSDFMDGSVSAPMNYTETGGLAAASLVWTGIQGLVNGAVTGDQASAYTCSGFTSTGNVGDYGDSSQVSGYNYFRVSLSANTACTNSLRLLCMETNAAGADLDPDPVAIRPQVTFSSGGTGTSNAVTVAGVTDAIAVSIVPNAGGTANIIKNGTSVGATTTTAGLNENLAFTLTAPTTLGTKNTATITIGTDTYTWWVGYADQTKEAIIFVTSGTQGGNYGGLTGADNYCTNAALASSRGLSTKWKAVLSDSNTNAIDHLPWNWGVLKTVNGTVIVSAGLPDLFDGSIAAPIDVTETGASVSARVVRTNTTAYGVVNTAYDSCQNWTLQSDYGGSNYGYSNFQNTGWVANGVSSCYYGYSIYCMEDIDNAAVDTMPNTIILPYPVQVTTSSRQTSAAAYIGGMSAGATVTMTVTATGGTPTFTVNGGAEVTSATVKNGDKIIFRMNAPATDNSSNKMTITAGGMTSFWRVWTGDSTGSVTKHVFLNQLSSWNGNIGGVAGADTKCQSAATAASLGGTWKAILSGQNEPEYAVNRIGYNWTTLQQTDGTNIVMAGNIWSTATIPLLNPIVRNAANNASYSVGYVVTNTDSYGNAVFTDNTRTCTNWTTSGYTDWYAYLGTSGVTNSYWINNAGATNMYCNNGYNYTMYYYCIEQ